MLRYEKIHNPATKLHDVVGVCGNAHAFHNGRSAGRRTARQWAIFAVASGRFRLHDAHAAGAERLHPRIVAQIRNVHPGVHRRLDYHLARIRLYLNAIYRQADLVCHTHLRLAGTPVGASAHQQAFAGLCAFYNRLRHRGADSVHSVGAGVLGIDRRAKAAPRGAALLLNMRHKVRLKVLQC